MHFSITLCLVSMITVICLTQSSAYVSQDFCRSYVQNNYTIDSTFQCLFHDQNEDSAQLLLIIGHHYWHIKLNQTLLTLNTNSSYSYWFDRQYTGFCMKFDTQYGYGLLNVYHMNEGLKNQIK